MNRYSVFNRRYHKRVDRQINFQQLVYCVENPGLTQKSETPCLIATDCKTKLLTDITNNNKMLALWMDIDEGNVPIEMVERIANRVKMGRYVIYSSSSASASDRRWRLIIELARAFSVEQWLIAQRVLSRYTHADHCSDSLNQVFYLPTNPHGYYEYSTGNTDVIFAKGTPFVDACIALKEQQEQKTAELLIKTEKSKAMITPVPSGSVNVIELYNEQIDIGDILMRNGYKAKGGKRWISPNSTSGDPGIISNGNNCVYCVHQNDVLTGAGANGVISAFEAFRVVEYGGDNRAALIAAGNIVIVGSMTATEHNREAWRLSRVLG